VPTVFLQHTRVSSGGLAREQLDPGGSWRSCPSEPIRLCHLVPGSTTSNSSYPSWLTQPLSPQVTTETTPSAIFHPRQPFPGELLHHPRNLVTVKYFSPPILFTTGIHFPPILFHNQSYPKVCSNSLNFPNAGDSFAGISSLSSCSLFSPTKDLFAVI
jgi:hypothetical protein